MKKDTATSWKAHIVLPICELRRDYTGESAIDKITI